MVEIVLKSNENAIKTNKDKSNKPISCFSNSLPMTWAFKSARKRRDVLMTSLMLWKTLWKLAGAVSLD